MLGKIFEINTETEICLPKNFDICFETEQIWRNTFVRTPQGQYFLMEVDGEEYSRYNKRIE